MLHNEIPGVCFFFSHEMEFRAFFPLQNGSARNSDTVPRNGLERNSESLLLFLFHSKKILSILLLCGTVRNLIPRLFCSAEQAEFRRNKRLPALVLRPACKCNPDPYLCNGTVLYSAVYPAVLSIVTEWLARICKRLRSPGVYSKEPIPPAYVARAGIFKESMGARNRGGIGLSYRPARLHRLEKFIPRNRFLGSINV